MSSSAGKVLIMPKGEYNNSTQYQMLDAVRYNGSLYIAKKTTMGNTPVDGEYWMLSATGQLWGDISGDIANQTDLQNALNAKQNTLTFDSEPTAGSTNPVTSGGIKTALDAKMPNPSGGVAGDVLVKKATGVDWETLSASDIALGTGTVEDLAGSVATIELSPALNTYAIGDFLLWNGVLYKVTAHIDAGENLVVGTNISAVNVGAELTSLNNGLTDIESTTIPASSINESITVSTSALRKYGRVAEIYLEGTTTAQISSWAMLINGIPSKYRPFSTSNAYSFTVGTNPKMVNFNNTGVLNAPEAIAANTNIRFHAVYFTAS